MGRKRETGPVRELAWTLALSGATRAEMMEEGVPEWMARKIIEEIRRENTGMKSNRGRPKKESIATYPPKKETISISPPKKETISTLPQKMRDTPPPIYSTQQRNTREREERERRERGERERGEREEREKRERERRERGERERGEREEREKRERERGDSVTPLDVEISSLTPPQTPPHTLDCLLFRLRHPLSAEFGGNVRRD